MSLDGRLWLTFNGELYNYIELRAELRSIGRQFETRTDTEVVLQAYDEWGPECLERFNGMWSFALWDRGKGSLLLATDCSGMKPLHYYRRPDSLLFASEIKALLEDPTIPRKVDRSMAHLYLLTSVDSFGDRTFFEGIKRLPGGHAMQVSAGPQLGVEIWRWWYPKRIDPQPTFPEAASMLRQLLRDSIRLRYRSDVPVGISLSGGLDSGGIVCVAADMARKGELHMPDGLRTFTAATVNPSLNEAPAAARLASVSNGRPYSVCPTADELRNGDLDHLVRHHDEPVRSLSTYMQFRVMRLARENETVVILSGQGPDELLWGYPWQYPYAWRDLAASGQLWRSARSFVDVARHGTAPVSQLLGYAAYALIPAARLWRYRSRVGPFLAPELMQEGSGLVERIFGRFSGPEHFALEVESVGLPSLLRYEDRNSMAFSVESRLPYLDPRILDLAYSVPSWMRMNRGWSKAILRAALEDVAPPDLVRKRDKLGFGAPEAEFLAAIAPEMRDAFGSGARSRDLLRSDVIRSSLRRDVTPPGYFWRFYNFELWMRTFEVGVA